MPGSHGVGPGNLLRDGLNRRDLSTAVLVALGSWVVLAVATPDTPLHPDLTRDLLMARDCLELDQCHTRGPPSSFGGFDQGSLWIQTLVAAKWVGLSAAELQRFVAALHAASVGLLFLVARRGLSTGDALGAAGVHLGLLGLAQDHYLLWNPSISSLPSVAALACLLALARSGAALPALAAGLWIGVAIESHGICALLVPVLVASSLGTAQRPALSTLSGLLMCFATPAVMSPAAVQGNAQRLASPGSLIAIVSVLGLAALLGRGFRRKILELSPRGRGRAVLAAIVTLAALAQLGLLMLGHGRPQARYAHPALPALALLIADVVSSISSGIPRFAWLKRWAMPVVGLSVAAMGVEPPDVPRSTSFPLWTMRDVETLAPAVIAASTNYDELRFGLQGPDCRALAAGLGIFAPLAESASGKSGAIRALYFSDPPGLSGPEIELRHGRASISAIDSWLDRRSTEVCYEALAGGDVSASDRVVHDGQRTPRRCSAIMTEADAIARQAFIFNRRSYPELYPLQGHGPYRITQKVPVTSGTTPGARVLRVFDTPFSTCPWQIARVEGLRYRGELPAREVRISSGGTGNVIFAKTIDHGRCRDPDEHYLPCVLEVAPGEERILGAFGGGESLNASEHPAVAASPSPPPERWEERPYGETGIVRRSAILARFAALLAACIWGLMVAVDRLRG